jgi:hypothetical protein
MRYTSRKLMVAVALVVLATWMRYASLLSEAGWLDLVKLALGGYFAANVGQKAIEQIAQAVQAKLAPPKA